MTDLYHWWLPPLAMFIGYVGLGARYVRKGNGGDLCYGLGACCCLVSAVSLTVGHFL